MIPTMIVCDTIEELDAFLNSLGVPCQAEEPKEKVEAASSNIRTGPKLGEATAQRADQSIFGNSPLIRPIPPAASKLTGGKVNYYTVKVDPLNKPAYTAECGDIIDALGLTFNEANIFKEIWRTANARLGNGKPGNTALRGAEKVAYYANRILEAEKQKA